MNTPFSRPFHSADDELRLLDRWLAGECDTEESRRVAALVERDPRWQEQANQLAQQVRHVFAYPPITDPEIIWERLQAQNARRDRTGRPSVPRGQPRLIASPSWWRRGVVLAGVAAAALIGLFVVGNSTSRPLNTLGTHVAHYATRTGERATITLADGSRITLAPETDLRIDTGAATPNRTVTLRGEAIFNVTSASTTPFIVQTGRVVTRVLGTRFTVRHYATDAYTRVAVERGRVIVTAQTAVRRSVTLGQGMLGEVGDSVARSIAIGDATPYSEWTDESLVFRHVPMSDVFATLARWYGYQFEITDKKLEQESVTVVLSTESSNASLSETLATLKKLLDVDLKIDGRRITVSPHQGRTGEAPVRNQLYERINPSQREIGR